MIMGMGFYRKKGFSHFNGEKMIRFIIVWAFRFLVDFYFRDNDYGIYAFLLHLYVNLKCTSETRT